MKTSIIRPGMLVGLKTAIRGGVTYQKLDLEPTHATEDGTQRARWETTREIADAVEHERATQTRSRVRTLITRQCCNTSFGLLCPDAREENLQAAIVEADLLVNAFNLEAEHTNIDFRVLVGRVANDDVQAARAIGSEVRDLLATMESSIKAADPGAIREAATKARQLAGMLSADAQGKVKDAITEARNAATEIVRRVEKAGEVASIVVDELTLTKLKAARFAVLDLSTEEAPPPEVAAAPAPAAPAIDFAPVANVYPQPVAAPAPRDFEFGA